MDRSSTALGGFLAGHSPLVGNSTNNVSVSTDAYVIVTLGDQRHSGLVADMEEEDLQHDAYQHHPDYQLSSSYTSSTGMDHPMTTTTTSGNKRCYTARTKVCRRTLNPDWDEEFRFEVADDTLLQDEPLIFRVLDSTDAISTDESIGLVYVDLNPLLTLTATEDYANEEEEVRVNSGNKTMLMDTTISENLGINYMSPTKAQNEKKKSNNTSAGVINGWFPLYDTLGGVRGELGLSVKLDFIGDVNPFRDSSAGVQLFPFSTLDPASGYMVSHVFGFVEELVVADDPEFEWKNNFRQARTSNETRQSLLYLLDLSVRRRMCKKVLEVRTTLNLFSRIFAS